MKHESIKIRENVNIRFFPTDKFKTNYISVNFVTPVLKETAAREALLFEVLTRGTEKYPTLRDINIHLDDCYGMSLATECTKSGADHVTGFSLSMLANSCVYDESDLTGAAIDMIDQIVNHPVMQDGLLSESYTEQEKEKLCEKIEAQILRKARYAISRCGEIMCEGEKAGVPTYGSIDDVRAITSKTLTDCYNSLLNSARIEIYCVGSFTSSELETLGGVFASCASDVRESEKIQISKDIAEVRTFEEVKAVTQATMAMGFRLGRGLDECANMSDVVMMNAVFGGGTVSKLFMNVREKMSLCYFCQSACALRSGTMYVVTGVEAANIEKTKSAVLDQLGEIAKGNITDEEFEYSKMEIRNGLRAVSDSPAAIESWYLGRMLAEIDTDPEKEIEKILAVTREDIAASASAVKLDTVFVLRGNGETEVESDEE